MCCRRQQSAEVLLFECQVRLGVGEHVECGRIARRMPMPAVAASAPMGEARDEGVLPRGNGAVAAEEGRAFEQVRWTAVDDQ